MPGGVVSNAGIRRTEIQRPPERTDLQLSRGPSGLIRYRTAPMSARAETPPLRAFPPAAARRWTAESEPDRRAASCAHGTIEQKNFLQKIIWAVGSRKTTPYHPQHSFSKFLGGSMPASQKFTIDISVRYAIIRTYIRRTLVLSCKGQEAS